MGQNTNLTRSGVKWREAHVLYADSNQQLRGTAGARQVTVKAETALAGCSTPDSNGFIMFSKYPS